jgi:hypothetical protein
MRLNLLLALLLSIVLSGSAFALESAYEKHVARGISAIEMKDYKAAAGEFSAALKESPDDMTATLYLGIALSRSGDKDAGPMLKKALSMKPDDPRTNLELGIYYFDKAIYDEASDYFENTIKLAPNTPVSAKAEEYLKSVRSGGVLRPYSASVMTGIQYDTNVIINPENGVLPQGISGKSDWSAVLGIKGRYNFVRERNADAYAGYSLYQNLHNQLSHFNVTQHLFELGAGYRITPSIALGGSYAFEYILAGGDGFSNAHSLNPTLKITEGPSAATILEYRYRKNNYINSDFYVNNADRTGSNNMVGITQDIKLTDAVRLKAGYYHDTDSTRKDYWDYRGDKVRADLGIIFPQSILLNINGEYYKKQYEGIYPSTGEIRNDKTYTAAASATKLFSDKYSVTFGELYIRNKSNINLFDYKRSITSIFLYVRF